MGRDGGGVVNSDFVLYISAKTIGSCPTSEGTRGTLAFAKACQMESEYDRSVCVCVCMCTCVLWPMYLCMTQVLLFIILHSPVIVH